MNVVTLIGNLESDVTLDEDAGRKRARFLIAVDRGGTAEVDCIPVVAWERQAETCAEYLSAGRRIALDGRLRSGEDGQVEVVANRVQFLSAAPATQEV